MRRLPALLAAATLAACSHDEPAPPGPPAPPTGVLAFSPAPGMVRVWWQAAPEATSYAVYAGAGPIDPATATRAEVPPSAATGHHVTGFTPGSTVHVAVASIGPAGEGARSPDVAVDVRSLAELTTAVPTSTTISLEWTPVADGTYVLYRSTASPIDPATATAIPVATAAYEDAVEPATTYFYAVSGVFDGIESPLGPERTVTTPPAAPESLEVRATAPGTLTLTWPAVAAATGYTAFCGTAVGLPDTATASASTTETTVDVTGLADGTGYRCAVRAWSAAGDGDLGPVLWTPTYCAAPILGATAIVGGASLTWTPVAGATAYLVSWAPGSAMDVPTTLCTAEACTFSSSSFGAGAPLQLWVDARNAFGIDGPASNTVSLWSLLEAPTLSATPGAWQVTLTWTDPNVPAAASYDLYWSDAGPVTLASNRLSGVTSPYVHAPLPVGRTYRYAVVAVGTASTSPLSAEATASLARTGLLATPVAIAGVTAFGQSIPAQAGDPEHFPGQSGYWELQPDFSIASGFDGPFSAPGAQVLLVGRLATSPPTFDSLVAEQASLDFFPYDQLHGELTFLTPAFTAADGVALAALSDGSTLAGLPVAPISGARSAFLNAASDARLTQPLDLAAVSAATVGWTQLVFLNEGLVPGGGSSFDVVLRGVDGAAVERLVPTCAADPAGFEACTAAVGAAALGQAVVLSFELRGAAPAIAEIDDVTVSGGAVLLNGGFETDASWATSAGAEPQNVTSGSRTVCVDGPGASPCATPLAVTRSFFTAPTSPWARVVDVFENPGTAEVAADVVYLTVAAAGGTAVTYDPGGAGNALAAYDASATPVRDFGLVLGDAVPYHRSASQDGLTPGAGLVFAVRPIVVPAGGRVALASFLVMDGSYSHRSGGTAATGIEQVASAIADGFASPTGSTYRDWLTQPQLDAIVNF